MLAWIVSRVGLVQCAFEGAFVLTLPLGSPRGERVEGCMSMETLHGLSALHINPFFSNPIESQGSGDDYPSVLRLEFAKTHTKGDAC